jgi:hypothetical protein
MRLYAVYVLITAASLSTSVSLPPGVSALAYTSPVVTLRHLDGEVSVLLKPHEDKTWQICRPNGLLAFQADSVILSLVPPILTTASLPTFSTLINRSTPLSTRYVPLVLPRSSTMMPFEVTIRRK